MKISQIIIRSCCGWLAFIVFLAAGVLPLLAAPAAPETAAIVQSMRPVVEVMFVLDTTGSMSGLIAAAKEKIWSIANTLASADPAPVIRMGLVGYRDRGDVYVTAFADLSEDLDAVYARLMQFVADGGGDTPESVNQALFEAVNQTRWSTDPAAYRVVFLVGDAPPQMNYSNDVPYGQSCSQAIAKGIIINTIQCGDLPETTPSFQAIARLAEGQYFRVAQSGNAVLYDTPFDRKIADLSRALDETRIYYGEAGQIEKMEARKKTASDIYAAAAPSAVAKRTIFNSKKAGAENFLGSSELVDDVASGRVELEKIEEKHLPAELKALNQGQRKDLVTDRIKQRQALQAEIDSLAKQRQAFIEEKVQKEAGKGDTSLDAKIYQCIQSQAAKKDIRYRGGPAY
jgi:Mg-chelatase subunit ChlD